MNGEVFFWVWYENRWAFVRKIRYNRQDDSYTVKFANRELKIFPANDVDRWQWEKEQDNA